VCMYAVFFPNQNVRQSVVRCPKFTVFLHRCELMVGTDARQSWQVRTLTASDGSL
jgi:hypothetical protein